MTLSEAVDYYESNQPRGEYVLVVEGTTNAVATQQCFWESMTVQEHLTHYLDQGLERMTAIKAVAKDRGVAKNEIYKQVID